MSYYVQHFGLGFAAIVPPGVNATPQPFALLEDLSFEYSLDLKKYRGGYRLPVAVGAGDADANIKIKAAHILGAAVAQITGGIAVVGSTVPVIGETATIPAATFTITVANGATFAKNYGVYDLTAGIPMTKVPSAPAAGQYSVNETTGAYVFAAADVGHKVSFIYTNTAAALGQSIGIPNVLKGIATGIQIVGYGPSNSGKPLGLKADSAFVPKLAFGLKPADFAMYDLEGFATADPGATAVTLYTGE